MLTAQGNPSAKRPEKPDHLRNIGGSKWLLPGRPAQKPGAQGREILEEVGPGQEFDRMLKQGVILINGVGRAGSLFGHLNPGLGESI